MEQAQQNTAEPPLPHLVKRSIDRDARALIVFDCFLLLLLVGIFCLLTYLVFRSRSFAITPLVVLAGILMACFFMFYKIVKLLKHQN